MHAFIGNSSTGLRVQKTVLKKYSIVTLLFKCLLICKSSFQKLFEKQDYWAKQNLFCNFIQYEFSMEVFVCLILEA